MKFEQIRPAGFLNTKTFKETYAIQIKVNSKWYYAAEDSKPLFFKTEKERNEKIEEMKRPDFCYTEDELQEAWASMKIWEGCTGWVHSLSGRVFIHDTPKGDWAAEMNERYGNDRQIR